MLSLILLVFAFVLFVIAGAVNPPENPWRSRLVCFGLACVALADIVVRAPGALGGR
jgi:hypothetical protein